MRTNISGVRALTLDGCKRLTSTGFANLLDQCASTLERLSAEGCSPSSARRRAPRLGGASSAGVQRSKSCAFPARSVARSSRACRSLTEVRFERGTRALDVFDARNSALRRVVGVDRRRGASSTSRVRAVGRIHRARARVGGVFSAIRRSIDLYSVFCIQCSVRIAASFRVIRARPRSSARTRPRARSRVRLFIQRWTTRIDVDATIAVLGARVVAATRRDVARRVGVNAQTPEA